MIFLLDVSGSMRNQLRYLAYAANIFLHQLRPDDQLIFAGFVSGDLQGTFRLITDELGRQYNLGYYPSQNAGQDRKDGSR